MVGKKYLHVFDRRLRQKRPRIMFGVSVLHIVQCIGARPRGYGHVPLHSCLWVVIWNGETYKKII